MNDQEKTEQSFVYAEALWRASMHMVVKPDRGYVCSKALVRTSSGVVAKRDVVDVRPQIPSIHIARIPSRSLATRLRRIEPSIAVLVIGCLGLLATLLAIYVTAP